MQLPTGPSEPSSGAAPDRPRCARCGVRGPPLVAAGGGFLCFPCRELLRDEAARGLTPDLPAPRSQGVEHLTPKQQRRIEQVLLKWGPKLAAYIRGRLKGD